MLDYNPATRELTLGDVSRESIRDERKAERAAQRTAQKEAEQDEKFRAAVEVVRQGLADNDGEMSGRAAVQLVRAAGLTVSNAAGSELIRAARAAGSESAQPDLSGR